MPCLGARKHPVLLAQRGSVITHINSQLVKPRLEGGAFHPELGSCTILARNFAINLLENVNDVVALESLKG